MVTSFTYTPFSVSNEIRLLVLEPGESLPITCRLIHVRLSDKPDYEAVSYTWLREQDIGSQAQYDNIMLDNNEFRVTPNCYAALQHFRSVSHETVLWVDAICIDQENESEKNHQVQQMATIYPHANRVRIWLGVEELDDKIAVKSSTIEFRRADDDAYESDADWQALDKFLQRRWFRRGWIIQETAMATEAVMYCGHLELDWYKLADVASRLLMHSLNLYLRDVSGSDAAFRFLSAIKLIDKVREKIKKDQRLSVSEALNLSNFFQVTDERDQIFSLCGLIKEDQRPRPEYGISSNQLFTETVISEMLRTNSYRVLTLRRTSDTAYSSGRPSWVGDAASEATPLTNITLCNSANTKSMPEFRFSLDRKELVVRGMIIDNITMVRPKPLRSENFSIESIPKKSLRYVEQIDEWIGTLHPRYDKDDREEVLGRILCGDILDENQRSDGLRYSQFLKYWQQYRALSDMKWYPEDTSKAAAHHHAMRNYRTLGVFESAMADLEFLRVLFRSRNGFLGFAPESAAVGDSICIFSGGETPFVLRRQVDASYRFIGECYADGMMRGEIFDDVDVVKDLVDIVLR